MIALIIAFFSFVLLTASERSKNEKGEADVNTLKKELCFKRFQAFCKENITRKENGILNVTRVVYDMTVYDSIDISFINCIDKDDVLVVLGEPHHFYEPHNKLYYFITENCNSYFPEYNSFGPGANAQCDFLAISCDKKDSVVHMGVNMVQ